ncbi:MAG: trehalose-phosphatase [Rhodoferax sp.]
MNRKPLLAFDFDGTLAPIVSRPEQAYASKAVAFRLEALSQMLPVAIVTGRTIDDARGRLGFVPTYLVGNHGAQDNNDVARTEDLRERLAPLREQLQTNQTALMAAGVNVEDKGQSIALHYRLSRDRDQALSLIQSLLIPIEDTLKVFAGKMVVNAMAKDAPDKADALRTLVQRCGASCAFFAGDDVNDEPVFLAATDDWFTVRVGRDDPTSKAKYFLDGPNEMATLLDCMLAILSR